MLIDFAINHEMRFFRSKSTFANVTKLLEHKIQSQRLAPYHLAIWCCGFGNGQDAYALAMLCEGLKEKGLRFTYRIYATDQSEAAVGRMQAGRFDEGDEVFDGLPAAGLGCCFDKHPAPLANTKTSFSVKAQVQARMTFVQDDLRMGATLGQRFDLIFCNQILSQFSLEDKQKALTQLGASLKTDGYLVLGADETLAEVDTEFYPVAFDKSTFYQFDRSLQLAELLHQETGS